MIPNHACAALSALDLRIAASVPPGGNWRDIPEDVPSDRIAQIRRSAAAGEGSRSTYYGRLHPARPAFTVGTYYNRPGNGCFLHPDPKQDRTISNREAARLQSFPDDFAFVGTQRAICQQIGNAVPPLLGFQIARALGAPGDMVDVFAGAGGLSLGFAWQGWKSIAATDFDRYAVDTFQRNVAEHATVGDMNDDAVIEALIVSKASRTPGRPLALVGGPPCQGFSTGGKRRSEQDERNSLHERYALLLRGLQPDVFVFENVMGLLSMSKGDFVKRIIAGLADTGYDIDIWKLNAADYGVPQKRRRVVIVGVRKGTPLPPLPRPWSVDAGDDLLGSRSVTTVEDALSDLPAINQGQDGSALAYASPPSTDYQKLMRGQLTPDEFLRNIAIR